MKRTAVDTNPHPGNANKTQANKHSNSNSEEPVDTYPDPGNANEVSKSAEETQTNKKNKEQTKLATKKGMKSAQKFTVGDKVILQETTGTKRQWLETGVIREQRASEDGSYHSFIIDLDKGGQCLRNKRFLKHYRQTGHIFKLQC